MALNDPVAQGVLGDGMRLQANHARVLQEGFEAAGVVAMTDPRTGFNSG